MVRLYVNHYKVIITTLDRWINRNGHMSWCVELGLWKICEAMFRDPWRSFLILAICRWTQWNSRGRRSAFSSLPRVAPRAPVTWTTVGDVHYCGENKWQLHQLNNCSHLQVNAGEERWMTSIMAAITTVTFTEFFCFWIYLVLCVFILNRTELQTESFWEKVWCMLVRWDKVFQLPTVPWKVLLYCKYTERRVVGGSHLRWHTEYQPTGSRYSYFLPSNRCVNRLPMLMGE